MDTFGLRIIASDKVFFNGRCKKLTIPAPDGEKGVLAHHENMVIAVVVGIARMESTEGEVTEIAVGTGFAEIVNNRVTLLVDTAERPEDIDVRHAREQREHAQERMRQKQSIQEYYHTQASLARAMNRLFLETEDLSGLMETYMSMLVNRDRDVLVLDPSGTYKAKALGIDKNGELIVRREDGTSEHVYAGEVSVRGVYGYV